MQTDLKKSGRGQNIPADCPLDDGEMTGSLQPIDEDAALLASWRERGDGIALERLVEKYRAPLFSYIFRFVREVPEAEDCFQETWARVLPRLSRKPTEKLLSYLFTTAHHLLVDAARRARRSPFAPRKAPRGGAPDPEPVARATPADAADAADFRRALAAALADLPDAQRNVFLLRMEADVPFEEIARRERCPLGTVLSRMHYAVTRLRTALAPFRPKGVSP
jgi:RNA polymerase sigma-70 factor (ECF subfamily)